VHYTCITDSVPVMAGKPGMVRRSQFGTTRKLPSGRWQASYIAPTGERVTLGTYRTKGEARGHLDDIARDIRRGAWIDPAQSARTVRDVGALWLASNASKRDSTRASDGADLKHVYAALGDRGLGEVKRIHVERAVKKWSTATPTPSPRTIARRYATLSAVFTYATDHGWILASPCPPAGKAHLPKITTRTPTRRFVLDGKQLQAIAEGMTEEYRPMVYVGALTGLRWSEVAGLKLADLDLVGGTLTVRRAVIRGDDGPSFADTKSEASARTVPIPALLVDMLTTHTEAIADDPGALLFPAPNGGPCDDRWWRRRRWYPALETAGLLDLKPRPGFHDLRRMFGTMGARAGIDLRTLQGLAGHADLRTTAAFYVQTTDTADREASDAIAAAMALD
jgi:integrase